jgi:branched-chain amino acid transport system permease protein
MSSLSMRPCGDFRTSYKQDNTIFETSTIRWVTIFTILALCFAPLVVDGYFITLLIQISYLGIAALGLNILVGYTGQISLGHGAFFGFGAFASAWLNTSLHIPVFLCIPLAGFLTRGVGMIVGATAARIKGLY